MKKLFNLILAIAVTITLFSCEEDDPLINDISDIVLTKEKLSGSVQKGPFINGTNVVINELTEDLAQTGKSFDSQITNSKGSFEVNTIQLISNYVLSKAEGIYFNEISGNLATENLALYAISDISDKNTMNINILSHLETPRTEYLIIENGMTFEDAKNQAQSEILSIFNINYDRMVESELLDISQSGEENAILLAVSSICQGYRNVSELKVLLSDIREDIKEDGILDNTNLGSKLINHAIYLDTISIKENLEEYFIDAGITPNISNFGKYISNFIENTEFEITEDIINYPIEGEYGLNLLDLNVTNYSYTTFSLTVQVPDGLKLKVKLKGPKYWSVYEDTAIGWNIMDNEYDEVNDTYSQVFECTSNSNDMKLIFTSYRTYTLEYYIGNMTEPIKTKTFDLVL